MPNESPPFSDPTGPVEIHEIDFGPGNVWQVRLRGDWLQIVDGKGRERHRSKGHAMTGTHFAMQMQRLPFVSTPNVDAATRMHAERFVAGAEAVEEREKGVQNATSDN